MLVIIIFGLVVAGTAAPLNDLTTQSRYDIVPQIPELEYRLIYKLYASPENTQQFLRMMAQYYKMFPAGEATQGVQGNEYKIQIPVNGLETKDVVITRVKAAALLVQAIDKQSNEKNNYIAFRPLPACVSSVTGKYNIENGVLEILFPLIPGKVCEEVPKVPTIVAAGATAEGHQNTQNAINVEPGYLGVEVNGQIKLIPILFTQKLIEILKIRVV